MGYRRFRKPITMPAPRTKVFGGECEALFCTYHKWKQTEYADGTVTLVGVCTCDTNKVLDHSIHHCRQYKERYPYNPEIIKIKHEGVYTNVD